MRELWFKIAHTGGATIVSMLASIAGLAITARVLGPAGRGVYAATLSWVTLFATLGTLSVGQVIIHHVAGRPEEEWLADVTGAAVTMLVVASLGGAVVLATLHITTHGRLFGAVPPASLALMFVALPFLLWNDIGRYILTALGRLTVSNWAQIGGALAGLAGIALFVLAMNAGVQGAIVAYILSTAAAALLTFRWVVRRSGGIQLRGAVLRRLLRGSAQLHFNAIGAYLFTQASVLVLNYYRSPAETGFYQLATQLFGLTLVVSSAVGAVAFELVARRGPDGAWPEQRRLLLHATVAACVLGAVAYVLAPFGVRLVAGEAFLPSVELFRFLLPALVGATFSTVIASQWIGRGLFLQAASLTLVVGLISVTCDLILIPSRGMRGALVSTLITYGVSVIGNGAMALWVQSRVGRTGAAVVSSAS
jgi:O-antigen/teichoic acid export membrane protein